MTLTCSHFTTELGESSFLCSDLIEKGFAVRVGHHPWLLSSESSSATRGHDRRCPVGPSTVGHAATDLIMHYAGRQGRGPSGAIHDWRGSMPQGACEAASSAAWRLGATAHHLGHPPSSPEHSMCPGSPSGRNAGRRIPDASLFRPIGNLMGQRGQEPLMHASRWAPRSRVESSDRCSGGISL